MNIHLPAILGFTRYQGFDPSPSQHLKLSQFLRFLRHPGPGGIPRARDPGHFGRGHGSGASSRGGVAKAHARRDAALSRKWLEMLKT